VPRFGVGEAAAARQHLADEGVGVFRDVRAPAEVLSLSDHASPLLFIWRGVWGVVGEGAYNKVLSARRRRSTPRCGCCGRTWPRWAPASRAATPRPGTATVGQDPTVTFQYSSTTLYQISDHIQWLLILK
jgi:hypothetical protein